MDEEASSQAVERHLGMWCGCTLLNCCHDESGRAFNCGSGWDRHVHSGNPWTGYLYPWSPAEWETWKRYWGRPDLDSYPEGTLQRLVLEAESEDWRKRERELRQRGS